MRRSIAIQNPARLSLDRTMLLIENAEGRHSLPLEDLALIVLDHEAIAITEPLLGRLGEFSVAMVVCNEKHLPSAILLPYEGHALMAQTLRGQIAASKPSRKRIWQTIVREKILSQARLLTETRGRDHRLFELARRVCSGDTTNREGAAASVYFVALFGEGFSRMRRSRNLRTTPTDAADESEDPASKTYRIGNALLNYGYAVLRALVARAVVCAGLHPALGIHHSHRENTFSLADDLMEPLRVLVDREVFVILETETEIPDDLTPALKRRVLGILTAEVGWEGGRWPLDAALEAYAAGVRSCLLGETKEVRIPVA